MSSIEIYHYDTTKKVIHIPGKIFGPTAKRNIRFVFDPGAYRTIIATQITDAIGYQATAESRRVSTTSVIGKEYGYTVRVQRLSILSFEYENIDVACFDLPEKYEIDGLLGLDLLEKFEITLRHKEKWIRFEEIKNPKTDVGNN